MSQDDDLMALLGVEPIFEPKARKGKVVECGEKAPRAKAAPQEGVLWTNFHSFAFGGYVARVRVLVCASCGARTKVLEGLFVEEIHESGARRMTALPKGAQWPWTRGEEHRCEQWEEPTDYCGECIQFLGFGKVVGAEPARAIFIKGE